MCLTFIYVNDKIKLWTLLISLCSFYIIFQYFYGGDNYEKGNFIRACSNACDVLNFCFSVGASAKTATEISFKTGNALYVHAVAGSNDADAWQAWQSRHDEDFNEIDSNVKYFFLPSSASDSQVEIFNAYSQGVSVNGQNIASGESRTVSYDLNTDYSVSASGKTYKLKFMKSSAEAAIYINNSDADGKGTDLMSYLNQDKSLSASATGAIVDKDGTIDNTKIKKIKGRGNTTWDKPKKPIILHIIQRYQ